VSWVDKHVGDVSVFVPFVEGGPAAEEAAWQRYAEDARADVNGRRIRSITYEHEDSRYVVTVGEQRLRYRRQTGPRGGYRKNADYRRDGSRIGTHVTAIIDAGGVILVYSCPPCGGWANPSLVGPNSLSDIEYFKAVARAESEA